MIKIDVEGPELEVLAVMSRLLADIQPVVIREMHGNVPLPGTVRCGTGRGDVARVDRDDRLAGDCERVVRRTATPWQGVFR